MAYFFYDETKIQKKKKIILEITIHILTWKVQLDTHANKRKEHSNIHINKGVKLIPASITRTNSTGELLQSQRE